MASLNAVVVFSILIYLTAVGAGMGLAMILPRKKTLPIPPPDKRPMEPMEVVSYPLPPRPRHRDDEE